MDDELRIAAKAEEALEYVERARGRLYDFHHLIGRADVLFAEVEEARPGLVGAILGRDAIRDMWTYQVIEDFESGYYADAQGAERAVRDAVAGGERHAAKAAMKRERRTDPG